MVLKVLKFGTRKLFDENKEDKQEEQKDEDGEVIRKNYEVDKEALDKLLDREA